MKCSVCENAFIIPKDNIEYNDKKDAFENEVCKIIDGLTEEEIANNSNYIWFKLANNLALILRPNQIPKKCSIEYCLSFICDFCNHNNKICLPCKTKA